MAAASGGARALGTCGTYEACRTLAQVGRLTRAAILTHGRAYGDGAVAALPTGVTLAAKEVVPHAQSAVARAMNSRAGWRRRRPMDDQ